MILPDDDEIYNVDQTYLGPPGYHVGRFRYRSLLLGPLLFAVGLAFVANTVGYSLLSVGSLVLITWWVTSKVVDWTSSERPLGVLATVLVHEIDAPREDWRVRRSSGSLDERRIHLGRSTFSVDRRRSHCHGAGVGEIGIEKVEGRL